MYKKYSDSNVTAKTLEYDEKNPDKIISVIEKEKNVRIEKSQMPEIKNRSIDMNKVYFF